MDDEVKNLLRRAMKDLVTLEITLFFQRHPDAVDSQDGLSKRLACEPEDLSPALDALAKEGIIDRSRLGDGRYEVFSLTPNQQLRSTLGRLSSYYHDDPASRAEIIRHIISNTEKSRQKIQPSSL